MLNRFILLFTLLLLTPAFAVDVSKLPVLPADEGVQSGDWLVEAPAQSAGVYRDADSTALILSNGLIRRTIRVEDYAATVGFDNLVTGEALLRGVKPEAEIQVNGVRLPVGGATGQPNYAFLRPEWIDTLQNDAGALQLTGYEVSKPQARMDWAQVRHHAPDVAWPPKGVYLRMDYTMPQSSALVNSDALLPSDFGRTALYEDSFMALDGGWTIHRYEKHERSSFENEGKVGEIYTPRDTAVYAERAWPEGATLAELTLSPGTDRSQDWGAGIALVWKRETVRFALRPGGNSYDNSAMMGVWDGTKQHKAAGGRQSLDLSKSWTLRMRLNDNKIHCEARPEGGAWASYHVIELPDDPGTPTKVRIGKLDIRGKGSDNSTPGDLVRLQMQRFVAYGPATAQDESLADIAVSVHYELYDGVPVLSKWITVTNNGGEAITLDTFTSEILAAVEHGSYVESRTKAFPTPNIHVETDYAFSGMTALNTSRFSVHWVPDPDYHTQVNYLRLTPCLLEVRPELGPGARIDTGETFESFHAFLLPQDSTDRERKGLAQRRMYRTVAPWATENPLMMHARFSDEEAVKLAIDQCAEVGFEMVILTFGSGFNIEDDSDEYIAKMKGYADYAKSKDIEIGGYSLLSSRNIDAETNVTLPEGERPTFGNAPCIGSEWGQDYFAKLYNFYENTGFMLLEHDGSYPGDACTSTSHPGHVGYADSRWEQWSVIKDFYQWCRAKGIYLNVPDYYYLAGSNKCGMGYREVNWSLPRAQQVIHTRQNIFDGTWEKLPSMGWMFVPLTEYHGGGEAATIEPLDEHKDHYGAMIDSNLGLGVQACYRGPRLFDTDATKAMVKGRVDWYKKYRAILESDVVHGRRADGRSVDWMLHVNSKLDTKGMLVAFNPANEAVTQTLTVPLYYTGLKDAATVTNADGAAQILPLDRDYSVEVDITLPAQGFGWWTVE